MSEYGNKIFEELNLGVQDLQFDKNALLDSMGVEDKVDSLTYEDIKARREIIKKRMIEKTDD